MRFTFPPLDSKKMRTWRLNYTITYVDERYRQAYAEIVISLIKNLAFVQGIECVISERHQFSFDDDCILESVHLKTTTDLVYFRSTQYSRMTRPEFRELIEMVFGGYPNIFSTNCPFEVLPQTLEALKKYPFPNAARPDFSVEIPLK